MRARIVDARRRPSALASGRGRSSPARPRFRRRSFPHLFDDPPRDGETEPCAAVPAAGAAVALLELSKQRWDALRRDARPGVADRKDEIAGRAALDQNPDAAGFGELDRVPG